MNTDASIAGFGEESDQEPISFAGNVKYHFVLMTAFFSIILMSMNQRKLCNLNIVKFLHTI